MTTFAVWSLALIGLSAGLGPVADDLDRDGVSDVLEQRLIERFVPQLWVDARECAQMPAEFREGSLAPQVRERNGTLYAQVSPSMALGQESPALELHYYHLWDRDCGPLSPHPLDVEHVSAILVEGPDGWTAKYWYAAAHEDTVCDASNAARAEAIRGVVRGPSVWVSAGKHASFLAKELCSQRGCGVDDCGDVVALPPGAVINLGERGHPLNGAAWIAARDWPLDNKLGLDFEPELLAALEASGENVLARVHGGWRATQFSLSVGGDMLGAMGTASRHGAGSIDAAGNEAHGAVASGFRAVGAALRGTARTMGLIEGREQ